MNALESEPASPKRLRQGGASAAVVIAAMVLAAGSVQLTRAGYSVDEEYTVFAVRGIAEHGIPLLPSNLLYDRGIAYSYVSWLAYAVTGLELPAYRAIGLASAALSVAVTFVLVRRIATTTTAAIAAAMLATSTPFWATATSGRFYAPFLLTYLVTLVLFTHRSMWVALFVAGMLARLTHELAFTVVAIPLVVMLFARGDRRHWLLVTTVTVAGLLVGQMVLFALHALSPSSGDTMVRRFFLWQVLNLFERPAERQFGIPLIVMAVAWLLTPRRAWIWTVGSLSVAAMILATSIAAASNAAPLSIDLVRAAMVEGSRYPLDMFWHIVRTTPVTLGMALTTLAYRASGHGGEWRAAERALHGVWIGWVLWFGVIESGITTNYLLLPMSFLLIAVAVDVTAIVSTANPAVRRAVLAFTLVAITLDQWRGDGSVGARLEAARPTIDVEGIDALRASLQPNDRVACTDELGCLMLVGRIDRWLALDDYVRERFLVRRGDAPAVGVYTGVPAAFRPADLFDGGLPDRVVIVDIFKEYPIGNSRDWLPRAAERDGLRVIPLLETPQMRVLQVSPPEAVVRIR